MIQAVGFFIGMVVALVWERYAKDFKDGLLSFALFVPCFFGFIVSLIILAVEYCIS